MKSFATSSFGALTSLFLIFANLSSYTGSVQAAVLPGDSLYTSDVPVDLIPDYLKLMDKCNADDALIAIQYDDGELFSYKSDKCFQRKFKDHPYKMALLCKTMYCKVYRTNNCIGDATLPIFVPRLSGGLKHVDPFDVGEYVGGNTMDPYYVRVLVGGSTICKATLDF